MFTKVGRWCTLRPKTVLAAWLLLAAGLLAATAAFGTATSEAVSIPGSDSQAAQDVGEAFPGSASGRQPLVLHTGPDGPELTSSGAVDAVRKAAEGIEQVDHVTRVSTPYGAAGASAMSRDAHTAYLSVELNVNNREITPEIVQDITDAAAPADTAGIDVTPGGDLGVAADKGSTGHSELIGLASAAVILVIGFGSLVAAGIPLLTGIICLSISVSAIGLLSHFMDMPSTGTTLAAMIGLGVCIDYALFCLTRFRELRATGSGVEDAAVRTMTTSGKAVAFAGSAVIAALAGLALGGLPLLHALALAPGIAVLVAVAATLTLLPAMLVLIGRRLEPGKATAAAEGSRAPGTHVSENVSVGWWARMAEHVATRPWRYLVAGLLLLGVLAAPATQLTFGQLDAGAKPTGSHSRTAYDRMADAFGPGINGTLQVTDTLPTPASTPADPRVTAVATALQDTAGVASVSPAQISGDGSHVRWQVTPTTAPSDPETTALIDRLRDRTLPRATVDDPGQVAHVGGAPAGQADLNDRLSERLPLIIATVVIIAGLLLLLAFRSPVLALKAAVMNLLSVGAAYGVLTAVFHWGWGATLIGLEGAVPIPGYVPLLMFAVLFGLSMDYEVFLLTAVREAFLRNPDTRSAVITGLAGTGRIITSAALIMVSVFSSYLLSDDPVIKMFGIGLAAAVALDATVVRGLLVPTAMVLLGRVNWWLPRRLDRLLPHVDIEGEPHAPAATAAPGTTPASAPAARS